MPEKIAYIELNEKTDKLAVEVQCPVEGNKYMIRVPYVIASCKKCGTSFRTDFKQSIYTKIARRLISELAYKNEVHIKASEKYEGDIIHIKEHFEKHNCWDVSKVTESIDEHKRCLKCGVCHNCFTCKNCGKPFERDVNRRKQKCPSCKKSEFKKTYFKEVLVKEDKYIKLCPHCKSDNITMTRTTNKTKCHLCGTTKLSETKSQREFHLIIKRKGGYKT